MYHLPFAQDEILKMESIAIGKEMHGDNSFLYLFVLGLNYFCSFLQQWHLYVMLLIEIILKHASKAVSAGGLEIKSQINQHLNL